MNLNVVFDVPARVAQGLMNGSLERVGGVVRDSSTKEVVMWLQEGVDSILGELGNDTILARDGERDVISCGLDADRVVADAIDVIREGCEQVELP